MTSKAGQTAEVKEQDKADKVESKKTGKDFPKMLYAKGAPPHIVHSDEDIKNLPNGNWYASPADISDKDKPVDMKHAEPIPSQPQYSSPVPPGLVQNTRKIPEPLTEEEVDNPRKHLEFEAEVLGMKVDSTWTNARLRREIHEFGSD